MVRSLWCVHLLSGPVQPVSLPNRAVSCLPPRPLLCSLFCPCRFFLPPIVVSSSFHPTPPDKAAGKDTVLEPHAGKSTFDQRRGSSCNREQMIPVARSMKLAGSMDATGAARRFQPLKYAPGPYDGLILASRSFTASALGVPSRLHMSDAAGNN